VKHKITIGLPKINKESGEKRDFLPDFVAFLNQSGAHVVLEHCYGKELGFIEQDYNYQAQEILFSSHQETYQQEYVLVLRYTSDEEISQMKRSSCLISMLHYPTRPQRVAFLRSRGLEGISLDMLKDDNGARFVEDLRDVAWNGVEVAFNVLRDIYPEPGFESPKRSPVRVTILGAGAVGSHAIRAAVCYGDLPLRERLYKLGVPGVEVTALDYDLTCNADEMKRILKYTDLLVDATQRSDTSQVIIPNSWISYMPSHAVILDLSVDPYVMNSDPIQVKGIEGIPQGNLDQYTFAPDDSAYDNLPKGVPTENRRHVVSCYSWPGIHPKRCMEIYGRQLLPIIQTLLQKGGIQNINPNGDQYERAIARAQLSKWSSTDAM
jgi:alanine dehydrogenase